MKRINITHVGGSETVSDISSLQRVFSSRTSEDLNEFWISGETRFPELVVTVRGEAAALHFFPRDGHPGFVSRGTRAPGEMLTFKTSSTGEEIQISSEAIVSFAEAYLATFEFVEKLSLPSMIRWFEL